MSSTSSTARRCRSRATAPTGSSSSRSRNACETTTSLPIPPGTSSHTSACSRQTALLRVHAIWVWRRDNKRSTVDLAGVQPVADFNTEWPQGIAERDRASDRAAGSVERGKDGVACGLHEASRVLFHELVGTAV